MKRTFTNSLITLFVVIISLGFSLLDEKGSVHLKVIKNENGEKSVFEKIYSSMDELKADKEFKEFDVLLDRWANEKDHKTDLNSRGDNKFNYKIVIGKKIGGEGDLSWISEDDEEIHERDKHIIIRYKDGEDEIIDVKKEKTVEIKKGDGDHNMISIDEEENKTEITDEDIEKMIKESDEGKHTEIHKKVEVITSDDEDGKIMVIVKEVDVDPDIEIDLEVKKEISEEGKEKIIEKKVWITKDGKKIELDEENDYDFETDGDQIKITIDDETMKITDFSDGNNEGDEVMVFQGKGEGNEDVKQIMNVNIEEKDGEQFIEIDIKRTNNLNVTISEILKDDVSLEDIDYSLKNNLKPSQLNYYPNPNNGIFNLKFTLDQKEEVTVKVIDILGNEVYKELLLDFKRTYDNQIDLKGKVKGIYILQIIQKRKSLTRKILVE